MDYETNCWSRNLTSQPPYSGEQTGPSNCPLGCPATHFAEEGANCYRLLPHSYELDKWRLISNSCPEDNKCHDAHVEQGLKEFQLSQ